MSEQILNPILESGATIVVDPLIIKLDPDEFLDHYGPLLNSIAIVAKGRLGFAYFKSNNAPQDRNNGVFFHSFCTIAENMGIKVHALVSVHADNFLSQNNDFRILNSDGSPIPLYVCPSHEFLGRYYAAIAQEITQYPIESIILDEIQFPSKQACFCDRCRRNFAKSHNIERDFSYNYLESKGLINAWNSYRSNLINNTIRDITDSVKTIKNIDVSVIIKTDRDTEMLAGITKNFGQNIVEITKITNSLIIHVNPWSDIPPLENENAYQQLVAQLTPLSDLVPTGIKISIYSWNINNTSKLNALLQLKHDLKADNLFVDIGVPPDFTKRRAISLGF